MYTNKCAFFKETLEAMKAIQGQQINGDLHQIRKQLSLLVKLHGKTFPLTYNEKFYKRAGRSYNAGNNKKLYGK